jgi:hypothetical protein
VAEGNRARLRRAGAKVFHGDVRLASDMEALPEAEWVIDAAANPSVLFGIRLNDTTNAFKAHRRKVIEGCKPILSPHFNLTVELPLKTIVRGYTWTIVPITWRNRRTGTAKLKLEEMGRWRISPWRWMSTHPHRWSQCDPRCFQAPATRS